ncbi:MAG: plasmid pRiA4b ORF-3 family protein, partial [Deltaproteobacteria bacterium]|nr:plasmid pRiA4b ORF-3 family protein [Deltaproteobacteria bacterium]
MPPKKPASPEGSFEGSQVIYQLKVTLRDSDPPIWRRFEVSHDLTLHKLHNILQVVMGWGNEHLFDFYKGREHLSKSLMLFQAASRARSKFIYLYDMGDSWE